jgi:non-specific serine/threonine protein kinase/serine/threonine-protein kinase
MQILGEAIERAPESRDGWVNTVCAGDEALRAEVARLLARQKPAAQFLEESPLATVAESNGRSMVGERVGLYKIISEIGRGGMGAVYLAERDDAHFTRRVALKLIKRGMDTDFVVQRFRSERQILASLDHPNIAGLIDGGATEADLPYFIMEYVEGQPINKYANANNLSTNERLKLFRTVCSAVQYAHQNLVIHRDLKPSNILVTKEGEPKLLDFGIAKLLQADGEAETELTATAVRVMTPEYASPEQIKGERITTSSDVYSLGVLLYELLTGQRPYRVKSRQPDEIAKAICEQEPERPSAAVRMTAFRVPTSVGSSDGDKSPTEVGTLNTRNLKLLRGDLDNIVLKALRKEPQRRYGSADQFSEDIRRHLEGLPVTARKATLSYRASKFVQRNKIGVAAAVVILLTLLGGIIATGWEARKARIESARAEQRFNEVRQLAHSVLFDYHDAIAVLPGSTAVRHRLVKDALQYLDNLSKETGNDTSLLRELAGAYEKVAAIQGGVAMSGRGTLLSASNLGDMPGALESLRKAIAIRERLFAMDQGNKEVQQELAFCYVTIGFLHVLNGPPDKAVENLRKGMPIMEELVAADPTDEDLQYKLWNVYLALAKALGSPAVPNLGDTEGALAYMNKAQTLGADMVSKQPTNLAYQNMLSSMHGAYGAIQFGAGRKQEALESYKKNVAIAQEILKRDPSNTFYRRQMAVSLGNLGNTKLDMNEVGALDSFRQALAIYESLAAADPNDADIRKNSAVGYRNVGVALGTGNRIEALNNFHKALQILAELVVKDLTNADYRRQWATTYLLLSRFQSQANDLNGAVDSANQGIKIDEALVASSSTNVSARNTLAQLDSQLGASHAALGTKSGAGKQNAQWQAAKDAYQKSLDIYEDMKSKGTLSGADAGKADELAKEIAKCDAALRISN